MRIGLGGAALLMLLGAATAVGAEQTYQHRDEIKAFLDKAKEKAKSKDKKEEPKEEAK